MEKNKNTKEDILNFIVKYFDIASDDLNKNNNAQDSCDSIEDNIEHNIYYVVGDLSFDDSNTPNTQTNQDNPDTQLDYDDSCEEEYAYVNHLEHTLAAHSERIAYLENANTLLVEKVSDMKDQFDKDTYLITKLEMERISLHNKLLAKDDEIKHLQKKLSDVLEYCEKISSNIDNIKLL